MFGLRFLMDCAHRTKNGQPAHATIGRLSASSNHARACGDNVGQRWPHIASTTTTVTFGPTLGPALGAADYKLLRLTGRTSDGLVLQLDAASCSAQVAGQPC